MQDIVYSIIIVEPKRATVVSANAPCAFTTISTKAAIPRPAPIPCEIELINSSLNE